MRIIAGRLGGRQFTSPKSRRTHPISNKARGALFNALGDISGLTLLDVFAGSGGISFEAISRGAQSAVAIDIDKGAYQTMVDNLKTLGLGDLVKVIRANANSWSLNNPDQQFDLVVCDPPYSKLVVSKIADLNRHVKDGGVLILSWPGKEVPPKFNGFSEVRRLPLGDAQLIFYKNMS